MSEHEHKHHQAETVIETPVVEAPPAPSGENAVDNIQATFDQIFAHVDCGKFFGKALGCVVLQQAGPMQFIYIKVEDIDAVLPYKDGRGRELSSVHTKGNLNVFSAIPADLLLKRLGWV